MVGADARGASLTGLAAARVGVDGAVGSASACGFAGPLLTTASVSETGAAPDAAGVVDGAVDVGGAGEAATGTGCTAFWRTARYPPPAAAAAQPATSKPASTLELIEVTPEQGR